MIGALTTFQGTPFPPSLPIQLLAIHNDMQVYQKGQLILVGATSDLLSAATCGEVAEEYSSGHKNVICSPGPLLGRFVTVKNQQPIRLVIARVEVTIKDYGIDGKIGKT